MNTRAHIGFAADGPAAWVCVCGNTAVGVGFYPCDKDGNTVEPVGGWGGLFRCDKCGRIIEAETREIVGRAVEAAKWPSNRMVEIISQQLETNEKKRKLSDSGDNDTRSSPGISFSVGESFESSRAPELHPYI
jgi:hypothetical protein